MLALGKKTELLDEYKKMVDEKPDSAAACYLYSRLLDDPMEEKDWLDKAKTLDDKFPYAYYGLGLLDNLGKDKENAEKNLKRAIELKPDFAHAYRALGMLYIGAAKPDDAEKLYLQAVQNLPKESFPHSMLCDLYAAKKDYDKALEQINAAIAISGDTPDFCIRKAEILAAKSDAAGATEALRRVCELDPTESEAADAYAIAAKMTTPQLGFQDPNYDEALKEIAAGKFADAIERLTKTLADKGDVALVHYQIARAYAIQSDSEDAQSNLGKAIEYYEKAANAAPQFADAFYGLADAQHALSVALGADNENSKKLLALSEKTALHALALNPLHPDANLLLAQLYHARGEFEKAAGHAAYSYKVRRNYTLVRPILIDQVRVIDANAKPEAEFAAGSYKVKVYPVRNLLGREQSVTRRFDVCAGDMVFKQFFAEVLTETDEATGKTVTKYYLCEILDKYNSTKDTPLSSDQEPAMDAYEKTIKDALAADRSPE
jgi:tetratricopeptide (TPR) repeat protein